MKELFANIWNGKAGTVASALCAAVAVIVGSDLDWPKEVVVGLASLAAFLGLFAGPTKPKQ